MYLPAKNQVARNAQDIPGTSKADDQPKASPCQRPGRPRGRAPYSDRLSISSAAITSEAVQDIPSASKADDPRQSQPLPTLRPSLWPCALLRLP